LLQVMRQFPRDLLWSRAGRFAAQIFTDRIKFAPIKPDTLAIGAPIDHNTRVTEHNGTQFTRRAFRADTGRRDHARLLDILYLPVEPMKLAIIHLILELPQFVLV